MEAKLGVPAQGGGAHPAMGTCNALWRLGDAYLEMLAVDPHAPAPGRPRMYGLDLPDVQARMAEGPFLLAWVASTDDLDAALAAAPFPIGAPVALSRGDLTWRLTVSADGRAPLGGAGPALIEWPKDVAHPVSRMSDAGLRLARLACETPEPDALRADLAAISAGDLIAVEAGDGPPRLTCAIDGPGGRVDFG
jgi:hypothetical protein